MRNQINLNDADKTRALIDACVKGHRESQQQFYQHFFGKMLTVCMRYAENKDEAKDMLHDGFIKVFSALKCFEHKGSLEGWVKRIITNTAIDAVRKKKNFFVELDEGRSYDNIADDFEDNVEYEKFNQIKVDVIMQLIQQLSPMYKMVFNLYVFEELTHKEIGEKLNINIGTSKSNYAKAKRNLIKLFEEHNNGKQ